MTPRRNPRSNKNARSKRRPKGKRGDDYQRAVAQVAKSLDPSATVEVGVWIDGPDGRRDLDVVIRCKRSDFPPVVFIECKDWNRPIGIAFIDALDSKRRDLGASIAMICSNSGFTAEALHKAARVGIPTLAALIKDDRRIRVVVRQQIYTRIVEFVHHSALFHHHNLSEQARTALRDPCYTAEWLYVGKSIEAWIAQELLEIAAMAPISRAFVARFAFRHPVEFHFREIPIEVVGIDIRAAFKVKWMTQTAEINASQGMYDYLRKVVVFGPGAYQYHVTVNSETWGEPVAIEDVPPQLLIPFDRRTPPAIPSNEMTLGMIKNMPQSDPKDAPNLAQFIVSREIVDEELIQEPSTPA
ncbi:MAG TPA: restriction endonuclease [Gemmataceae bacterium]|nr:restriction endonuclease [Gemmataceae bacterium]